ncbi:hypothetical protein [Candidatus Cyanaurora vandensis]|uniref:hypothetical protein n=1 Tax=Candidatus Cyanaurora vandensis TaxID=2714958 RepID=UPI00257E2375|nr:hypothetical protein [Candidatus Cyanaurora vandensis]
MQLKSMFLSLLALTVICVPTVMAQEDDRSDAPHARFQPLIVVPLPNILYDVAYARSANQSSEMVISIKNPNTFSCGVQVEWIFGGGGTQVGVSGPFTLAPQNTLEFTTANSGESISPFILNVFRDTTTEFEGSARIRSGCSTTTKLGVNALLVTGINTATNTGIDYSPVSVARPTGRVGD